MNTPLSSAHRHGDGEACFTDHSADTGLDRLDREIEAAGSRAGAELADTLTELAFTFDISLNELRAGIDDLSAGRS